MAFKTAETCIAAGDPRVLPAYSVAEAAHHLRMPEETLRSWVVGRWYPVAGQSKRSRPLIHLDDPQRQYLSFINLVEAHVLAAIRRRHGVKLPKVRTALDYVKRHEPVACVVPRGGVIAMRPLLIHSSSKARNEEPRRVLHIEYAETLELAPGIRLRVV